MSAAPAPTAAPVPVLKKGIVKQVSSVEGVPPNRLKEKGCLVLLVPTWSRSRRAGGGPLSLSDGVPTWHM